MRDVAKKLIFTFVWMVAGFVAVTILAALVAPLLPTVGAIDEHTSTSLKLTYISFALLPFVGIGAGLALSLFGKLPGTRGGASK